MNIEQRGIILLMKSAMLRKPCDLPEGFDLEAAYEQIKRHQIITLAYDGACRCGIDRQQAVMQKLFAGYYQQLARSEGQMDAVRKIMDAFDRNGIDYWPLKGCKMKALYPAPELRIMGDADIMIREGQYAGIKPILEALGFHYNNESDHELIWRSKQLYLELHKRLIPSYNRDFYAYFGEGWQLAKVETGTRYTMTPEDEMVFLFTHFSKHYRDGGIGCRHVLDLWVYRNAHPDLDETYIRSVLDKLHLTEFYDNLLRLLALWFENGPEDEKLLFMTDYIFASGSYGQLDQRLRAQAVKHSKYMPGNNGRLHYVLHVLFPSVLVLREKYTILQKAPWMLPVVWLIRPFYKVIFEWRTLKKQKRNMQALDQNEISQHQQMLRYVGLDYHF